jgi:2-C-methyl-D-erythritol 2,4-cyclodiphosphate synthase
MVFVALLSLGLILSPPSTSHTRPPAVQRHASVTSIAVDAEPAIRIGHGYDIHRMASREEAGQPLVIAGVKFDGSDAPDFELGCVAHSDGDVIYHSVVHCPPTRTGSLRVRCRDVTRACPQVDAILGALTMPDIGQLFPDNDPRLKGANSDIFMEEAPHPSALTLARSP